MFGLGDQEGLLEIKDRAPGEQLRPPNPAPHERGERMEEAPDHPGGDPTLCG